MRPRKKDRHLPVRMHQKHGRFWYVYKNKWQPLSANYTEALEQYARLISPPAAGSMTSLIDEVLAYIQPKLATNTITQYNITAKRLKEMLAEFNPDQVQPRHIAAIKMHLASTPNMANRILSFARVVFNYALENQLIDANPAIGIKRHEENKRDRYLTDNEMDAIWQAGSPVLRVIIDLCYLTAQRIGDVLAIKLTDITPDGIAFTQQKTGKRLIVTMTQDLQAVLDEAKRLHSNLRGMTLLVQRNGKPYSYTAIRDQFSRACKKAGVEDAGLHDLRAKSLTDLDNQGGDAQKLSGHTDKRMTDRYIRLRQIDRAAPPKKHKVLDSK